MNDANCYMHETCLYRFDQDGYFFGRECVETSPRKVEEGEHEVEKEVEQGVQVNAEERSGDTGGNERNSGDEELLERKGTRTALLPQRTTAADVPSLEGHNPSLPLSEPSPDVDSGPTFDTTLKKKIALGIQGRASDIQQSVTMYQKMRTRFHVTLFVLSYDEPVSPPLCRERGVKCVFSPHSTWASGRNTLLYEMRRVESRSSITDSERVYKYYAFADADLVNATCHVKTGCAPLGSSQCCFDKVVSLLMSPVEYAVVNFIQVGAVSGVSGIGGASKFASHDCADGAFNAYHRDAAPALLPYVTLVDPFSWAAAQAIMWTAIGGKRGSRKRSHIRTMTQYFNRLCPQLLGVLPAV